MSNLWWNSRKSQGLTKVWRLPPIGTVNFLTIHPVLFWDSIDCQPYRPTLPSLQSLTASVAKNEERKSQTTLFCEALPHRCLGDTSVTFVTYSYFMWWQYSASALYIEHFYNNFSTKKNGRVFIAAPFCDSGWWGGCYFDRNILPVLALTTPVVEFVWICCHVISFCSNYSQLIGKRKRVYSNHYANVVLTRDAQISPELKPGIQQCCLCSQIHIKKWVPVVLWEHFSKMI